MKSYRHYIKESTKKKYLAFVIIALLGAVLLYAVMEYAMTPPHYEPDIYIPLPNSNVSWEQSFHPGAWGNAG